MKRLFSSCFFVLICLVMVCVAMSPAFTAAQAASQDTEIRFRPGEDILNGIDIKLQLREKGYYSDNVPDTVFDSNVLDDHTLNALARLAEAYPDRPDYYGGNEGMTNSAWWSLTHESEYIKSIAGPAAGYTDIGLDSTGQSKTIEEIQKRLTSLNYLDKGDADYKPGELSPALFTALEAFLNRNGASELYDPEVILVAVQKKLLDTDPDLLVPAEGKSLIEKLRAYFLGSRRILGLKIPTLALWAAGVLLIAALVVVFIHFFRADGGDQDGKTDRKRSMRYSGKPVTFEITYGGITTTHIQTIDGLLKIGRNVGDFPLNLDDTSVSRRHCELYYQGKKLMLHDYSSGGTSINGELINNTQRALNSGDTLGIGEHSIKVTY